VVGTATEDDDDQVDPTLLTDWYIN